MYEFVEFPKWLHAKGRKSVLAENADAEAAQLAVWFKDDKAKLESLTPIRAGNNVVALAPQAANPLVAEAPKKGGWPKGKPRARKAV